MWVTNSDGDTVTKLRADGAVLGTFIVPDRPYDVAFDGANIWVANFYANRVTKLRASDGAVMGIFTAGEVPPIRTQASRPGLPASPFCPTRRATDAVWGW